MKKIIYLFLSLSFLLTQHLSGTTLLFVSPLPDSIEQYRPCSSRLEIRASQLSNPFDVNEISVSLSAVSPSGEKITQPGFYIGNNGTISIYNVRFTPAEIGEYSYQFIVRTQQDTIITKSISLTAVQSARNGFLRRNPESDYLLKFDSGKLFRGYGENVCWAEDYHYYFKKLNEIGCNFVRIWMCPWNLYLEWEDPGLGKYHLQNAARLDSVLAWAEKYNIYIMLCFDYHGVIQELQGYFKEKKWDENPYNQKNGGPCKTEADFFVNPVAKDYYKNRLQYIVARYGYSPHILAWEFWNEVDLTAGKPADVITWHKEMAEFLREIDPYDHLITTSFSTNELPEIWRLENIDLTQSHLYNKPNFAEFIPMNIERHQKEYGKPHVIGEFGSDYRGAEKTRQNDPEHVGIHNGLWAGLFASTPISPLTWWWDELIEADDLYFHFQAITNFAAEIATGSSPIEKIVIDDISLNNELSPDQATYVLSPSKSWGKNTVSHFTIGSNGEINDRDQVPSYLFGKSKSDMKQPPEFKISYKSDGRFVVHVDDVSDFGLLKIYLDGALALEKPLPLGEGEGEWEQSAWKEEINMYQGTYNKDYGIRVPAGSHVIRVENDGRDWIKVTEYKFENSGINMGDRIKVMAVRQNQNYFLWLRNQKYQWQLVKNKEMPSGTELTAKLNIPDIEPGMYQVEWWDTYQGTIFQHEAVSVTRQSEIVLNIPSFNKDVACKIYRKNSQ